MMSDHQVPATQPASYQQDHLGGRDRAKRRYASSVELGQPTMADYYSIIARAVSRSPGATDEARQTIYGQARTALHERLGNDPQISDAELVNEHYKLEVAIYEVEEDLLLNDMRRFVREETGFILKIKEFVHSARDRVVRLGVF